jgi:Zn-dependent M28 family amino/carboxypeptidase
MPDHPPSQTVTCKGAPPSASTPVAPRARKWTGTLPDKYVAALVELVSTIRLRATVDSLAALSTRHTNSAHIGTAADLVASAFQASGCPSVIKVPWAQGGLSGTDVVCTKPAASGPGDVIVVCAHYDSRMQVLSDATSAAPGADDNASGVAALVEIARLTVALPLDATVKFVAFSGEEQGLLGSTAFAQAEHAAGVVVRLLINLDMIGYPPPDGSVTVERDIGNGHASNDAASLAHANAMAQAAADFTTLPVKLGPIYGSDYMPFEALGDVVIGAYEGTGNPNYHNTSDTAATVDDDYLSQVTRMTLATILNEALDVVDESASPVDLYVRDSATDTGSQPSPIPHWTSPTSGCATRISPLVTILSRATKRPSTARRTTSTCA